MDGAGGGLFLGSVYATMALKTGGLAGDVAAAQGVGKVRNVGLDLRRWQSTAQVPAQSLLSGSCLRGHCACPRPGQRGLTVPLPAIRRHSARDSHVSTGASAQLRRLISDFADPLR